MKKSSFKISKILYIMLAAILLTNFSFCLFNFIPSKTMQSVAVELENDETSHISGRSSNNSQSLFIYSPTYTVYNREKLFFIDDYDKLLKCCSESKIINSLPLAEFGEIVDVVYNSDFLFILTKSAENSTPKLRITFINLNQFVIEQSIFLDISLNYNKIDVFDNTDSWIISLTPIIDTQTISETNDPVLLICNKSNYEISKKSLILEEGDLQKLFKIMIVDSNSDSNDYYLVLVFKTEVSFYGITVDNLTNADPITVITSNGFTRAHRTELNYTISAANTIMVDSMPHLLITYMVNKDDVVESVASLYHYTLDNVADSEKVFASELSINILNYEYILTSQDTLGYSVRGEQKISYTKFVYKDGKPKDETIDPISNPEVSAVYKTEAGFKYITTNKKTLLLASPWDSTGIFEVAANKDLIVIGEGVISGENASIEGYKFCMLSTVDKNIKGYLKETDFDYKPEIKVENYDYKVFKVQPNTNLYSLPTIIEENITNSLISSIKMTIEDNSRVEVIDAICKYAANNKIMLKVRVNDTYEGYIEYDKIIKPSDRINFVITNASIKTDNTLVHLNSDPESQVSYILSEGYRVRINGSRNTKTGYTSITFNDEYGNEFTGYILTDSIGSDSWTVMQIIGSILIAINIGLLILILKFNRKNVGVNGSKYIEKEK